MKKSADGFPIKFLVNLNKEKLWTEGSKAKIYWHATGYGENLEDHPELAEHFGISTVEAMSAGIVPVVIDAGGQREIVADGKNGLLWTSETDFKTKTLDLINDQKLLARLKVKAIERAKDFSEEQFESDIRKIILS
jgi:glycosyltransferase involved in cell wall biosynthesis